MMQEMSHGDDGTELTDDQQEERLFGESSSVPQVRRPEKARSVDHKSYLQMRAAW